MNAWEKSMDAWVKHNGERIVSWLQELVRIPTENRPPGGDEKAGQQWLAEWLEREGIGATLYKTEEVEGMVDHPLRRPEVQLEGRPNLIAHQPGAAPDESPGLLLSGHMDTVPVGLGEWTYPPFSGEVSEGRLYGRGAYDMKSGLLANFAVAVMLKELGLQLRGDLFVESAADEEFAGGHGAIAGRLAGYNPPAVIISEPSELQVYRAHRGLRVVRLRLQGKGGVPFSGQGPEPAVHHLPRLIEGLEAFGEKRNEKAKRPSAYASTPRALHYMITKIRANEWAEDAVLAVPETVDVEFFWETFPGETQEAVEAEFENWLAGFCQQHQVEISRQYSLRWMDGYELAADHPFTTCAGEVMEELGHSGKATGSPFPCDLYLYNHFGVKAGLLLGPRGGNAHAPDEYVELDSVMQLIRALGRITVRWCGLAS